MKRFFNVKSTICLFRKPNFYYLLLLANLLPILTKAQNSILSKGYFYKIGVIQTGIHKIDATFLAKAGIDISKINPQNIKIYGNGGAMLPQANNANRPTDLLENAIYVEGETDSKFDNQDYILFYGESPHSTKYDSVNKIFTHQINIYSDTTFYFLTLADSHGLRIKNQNSITATKTIDSFDDFIFHEVEQKNIVNSGRDWFGEYFGISGEQNFEIPLQGIIQNTPILLTSSVLSIAQINSSMQVKINNQVLGTHQFLAIGGGTYDVKGNKNLQRFFINSDGNSSLKITYIYDGKNQSSSGAYLDYFEINAKRKLQFYDKQTLVRSIESLENQTTNFQVAQVQNDAKIWDITNAQFPVNQLQSNGNFGAKTQGILKTFILFTNANLLTPVSIRKIVNQNLHNSEVIDLLIVTSKIWQNQAEKLAEFRRNNDKLSVLVVTTEEVYNEFSSGKPDVSAIRDFGRFLWLKNPQKFKYLLLFGDASVDYKNHVGLAGIDANNFVPVYESRESLNPVNSYSSDDYFGFFKDTDGEWEESYNGDQLLDIGIGRLPVKNIDEATSVVDKLIYYANQQKTIGKWRGKISFVADDGDYNIHQETAENLSKTAYLKDANLSINKIYIDAFPQISTPNGAQSPDAKNALKKAVEEGSLIVNYNGHGGERGWAEEQILTIGEVQDFKNLANMPLFLTATCAFGRYDNPAIVSAAELALLNKRGGAIGLLTTTRPVYANTNFILNDAFYETLFSGKNNLPAKLGDLMKLTKNNSLSGVNNRNFALLGDPSMKLNYPQQKIQITKINGKIVKNDTLKALSKVIIEGQILTGNELNTVNSAFNGTIFVSVYDKVSTISTLGAKGVTGQKMPYQVFKNQLFDGKASVKNGVFQVTFTVPKDIVYTYGNGRIETYAVSADSTQDAIGSYTNVVVGGSETTILTDNQPPKLHLFLNDENFQDGGTVGTSALFIAKIADENGINLSQAGIGHEMILTLNDTLQISVNDYYLAEINDFTKGFIRYPFQNLPIGKYTLRLKVWDTYNNSAEGTLNFTVGEDKFKILKVVNFPNPFSSQSNFEIQHNREGDDLSVSIEIFDGLGRILRKIDKNYYHSEPILKDLSLDGTNLFNGIYFYRIFVHSLTANLETSTFGKLIYIH